MDKIRSLINTHQQRSTDSIEDEPILLDEKNISTKVSFSRFFFEMCSFLFISWQWSWCSYCIAPSSFNIVYNSEFLRINIWNIDKAVRPFARNYKIKPKNFTLKNYKSTNVWKFQQIPLPQKDWEDHKDDPVEREEVMKSIDKILFSGDIDPSFKLLQVRIKIDLICLELFISWFFENVAHISSANYFYITFSILYY